MGIELHFTVDESANDLLASDPTALLIGIVLYQQVPVEKAFAGPYALRERLGGSLSLPEIATMEPEALEAVFRTKPALHRFPANMAKRTQAVAGYVTDEYGGDPTKIWAEVATAGELLERLEAIPGFGEYKATVMFTVLAKRFDIKPEGWEDCLATWPTVADIEKPEDRAELKLRKKAWKESQAKSA